MDRNISDCSVSLGYLESHEILEYPNDYKSYERNDKIYKRSGIAVPSDIFFSREKCGVLKFEPFKYSFPSPGERKYFPCVVLKGT